MQRASPVLEQYSIERGNVKCGGAQFKHILYNFDKYVTILASDSTYTLHFVNTREVGPQDSYLVYRATYCTCAEATYGGRREACKSAHASSRTAYHTRCPVREVLATSAIPQHKQAKHGKSAHRSPSLYRCTMVHRKQTVLTKNMS